MSHIATEVHAEVSQVFHDNDIVLRSEFANDSQFFFFQANPCRIVRIRIYDSSNVTLSQERFQLFTKRLASVMIDIEFFPLCTDDAKLGLLNRETRVDEQDLVLTRCALGTSDERAIRARHTTHSRHTRTWRDIHIKECLHETGSFVLQFRHTRSSRIL